MKEKELREIAECSICHNKIGKARPIFHRVTIKNYMLKEKAIQRQAGLELVLDGAVSLAQVLGPDEDMATCYEEYKITVCSDCAVKLGLYDFMLVVVEPEIQRDMKGSYIGPERYEVNDDGD